jgi:hypothetical protein
VELGTRWCNTDAIGYGRFLARLLVYAERQTRIKAWLKWVCLESATDTWLTVSVYSSEDTELWNGPGRHGMEPDPHLVVLRASGPAYELWNGYRQII